MLLTSSEVKFKKFACVLGFIQGLTWEILSLICIILYFKHPSAGELETNSYMEHVQNIIYIHYIIQHQKGFEGQVLTSDGFFALMCIHFILNVLWAVLSGFVLKNDKPKSLLLWSYLTLLVAVLDFITFVVLGADYASCIDFVRDFDGVLTDVISLEEICTNSCLPVFVIAAKGFTLWVINIALGLMMYKLGRRLK